MNDYPNSELCPSSVIEEFKNYRDHKIPPSSKFVQACLENKLLEAFLYADDTNRENLSHIVSWLYWYMPTNLWKSKEAVDRHLCPHLPSNSV